MKTSLTRTQAEALDKFTGDWRPYYQFSDVSEQTIGSLLSARIIEKQSGRDWWCGSLFVRGQVEYRRAEIDGQEAAEIVETSRTGKRMKTPEQKAERNARRKQRRAERRTRIARA